MVFVYYTTHILILYLRIYKMAFDINKISFSTIAETGHEFQVCEPSGLPIEDVLITVRGELAPSVQHQQRLFIKRQEQASNKGNKNGLSTEDFEQMAIDAAVGRVISWKGFVADGKPVECTPENVRMLLTKETWLRSQILEQSNDPTNFTM
jgi:hypothetical protein